MLDSAPINIESTNELPYPDMGCLLYTSQTINITAYENEALIGCLRILTDGYYFGTITELLLSLIHI